MKSVLFWCGLSAAIILTVLLIKCCDPEYQGALLAGALLLANALIFAKVCIGSR